ncbi:MAG: hydantoinase B/oxoprolinase family protein [Phycisphaerales bacterium]|nr:hydantoinase B/oxoprolinase family protein [Phycisphaerales bacterium]
MKVFVDRGGTFTDVIAVDDAGELHTRKVLSVDDDVVDPVSDAISTLSAVPSLVHLGTTVATNALLTRSGVPTALVLTQGLGDLAWIGDQRRPSLFDLNIRRPAPLHQICLEAPERLAVDGRVLLPLDHDIMRSRLQSALDQGCSALAICLLHGWAHGGHERQIRDLAVDMGFDAARVVCSSDCPVEGLIPRMQTLVADAALTPVVQQSLGPLRRTLAGADLACMHSAGGLVDSSAFRGVQAVLSGPAGGVVAAAQVARAAGVERTLTLDMGGTSTDVAWIEGELERSPETHVGGLTLAVAALKVETVAAGGGSICHFDGVRLRVGPDSAGAHPGPACHGLGGPPTITDCLVVLGRLPADVLPSTFGPNGNAPADAQASKRALEVLHAEMKRVGAALGSIEALAQACCDLALEHMAAALRRISTEQGRSLADAALVAFGGAGGLLACPLAARLNIGCVLCHPLGGLLSAMGIAQARPRRIHRSSVRVDLHDPSARAQVEAHVDADATDVHIEVAIEDWDRAVTLPAVLLRDPVRAHQAFREACLKRYGWDPGVSPAVIIAVRSERVDAAPASIEWSDGTDDTPAPAGDRIYRHELRTGHRILGPCVVVEIGSTVFVDEGFEALVLAGGTLQITPRQRPPQPLVADDAAGGALAASRLSAIADEMGALLRFTARSVNIRERLDYSCAIFTPEGDLVANGPHMPVHLGSMGASVRHVMETCSDAAGPGDAVLLNHPFRGGTHLPDLTVVSRVFDENGAALAWVASRGHHSDVGSTVPGSMPPDATTLEEEGVIIDALPLVRDGKLQEASLRLALSQSKWPCRAPDRVLDDLRAQLAANQRGINAIEAFACQVGPSMVRTLMGRVLDQGEALVRQALKGCSGGETAMLLDEGGEVQVRVEPEDEALTIDFRGTRPCAEGNTNAPEAVTRAAVLYVLRALAGSEIALNDGCLRPVRIMLEPGSLLSPPSGVAVAGGNVETSQQVVDALLAALGLQAASQGTMNNLAFGDGTLQHYETICGGTGAGPSFDGAHCVQAHMTNSRLTDPELLERRFPVRLWRLERRLGSGGEGTHRGGDGVCREVEWRAPLRVSLLSSRRLIASPGLAGGAAGQCGRQWRVLPDGSVEPLEGRCVIDVEVGERLVIETPGGGGWGAFGDAGEAL